MNIRSILRGYHPAQVALAVAGVIILLIILFSDGPDYRNGSFWEGDPFAVWSWGMRSGVLSIMLILVGSVGWKRAFGPGAILGLISAGMLTYGWWHVPQRNVDHRSGEAVVMVFPESTLAHPFGDPSRLIRMQVNPETCPFDNNGVRACLHPQHMTRGRPIQAGDLPFCINCGVEAQQAEIARIARIGQERVELTAQLQPIELPPGVRSGPICIPPDGKRFHWDGLDLVESIRFERGGVVRILKRNGGGEWAWFAEDGVSPPPSTGGARCQNLTVKPLPGYGGIILGKFL